MIPKKTKIQIAVLLILVIGVGSYFWYTSLYSPLLITKQEKAEDLQKLKTTLEMAKRQAARRASVEREYKQLQEQWQVVETLLPRERNMADFIQQLHRIKGKVDATVERVSPLPAQAGGFYMENPYEVEMLTTYHALGRFFSHVANLPLIVDVSDLDIMALPQDELKRGQDEREILGPSIGSRFVLTTYSLLEELNLEGEGEQ